PRPLNMPWLLKTVLGESPAIIGKQIPIELFRTERECEISLNIVHSGAAKRILTVLRSGASSLDLELGVLLESQAEGELPEQLIGGFRVTHPDLTLPHHQPLPLYRNLRERARGVARDGPRGLPGPPRAHCIGAADAGATRRAPPGCLCEASRHAAPRLQPGCHAVRREGVFLRSR
ncbi:unnamed protein product, partial [Prorocentrum cordatum]